MTHRLLYSAFSIFVWSFFLLFVVSFSLLFVLWSITNEQMFCKHLIWLWMRVDLVLFWLLFAILSGIEDVCIGFINFSWVVVCSGNVVFVNWIFLSVVYCHKCLCWEIGICAFWRKLWNCLMHVFHSVESCVNKFGCVQFLKKVSKGI